MSPASTALTGLASLSGRQLINLAVRATSPKIPSLSMSRCTGLGLALAAITRGDASRAPHLYRGTFEIGGCKAILAGTSIFELPDERPLSFDHALHGFGWLHDLHAGNTQLYRIFARGLVGEWLELKSYRNPAATDALTSAFRLIHWIQCAPFLLKGASRGFEVAFLDSLTRQTRRLARRGVSNLHPFNRLMSSIAMVYATLGTTGLENLQKTALSKLSNELDQQVLEDGGHVSRNGETLVNLLALLLPVRDALNSAYVEVPAPINAALERMLPMLRFMCHSDGGLAVFNGVSKTSTGRIKAILERDTIHGKPLSIAPLAGYARMAQGRATLIMDTGNPAAPGHNKSAASSALAFELCDGPHRIVVNCGNRQGADENWQSASRLTSAHSTVTVGDLDTSIIIDNLLTSKLFETPVLLPRGTVDAEIDNQPHGSLISARQSSYVKAFGLEHQRQLFLNVAGNDLRGEDRFMANTGIENMAHDPEFAVRFHLHPSVKATMSRDGASIMLVLPNKAGWRFSARGGRLSLDSSIYLPDSRSTRPTQQIVISGIAGRPERVLWAFKRMKKAPRAQKTEAACAPELPLNAG